MAIITGFSFCILFFYLQKYINHRCSSYASFVVEARLERIKGTGSGKSPAPKDIIEGLDRIRTAQLYSASVGPSSSLPYIRNCDYVADVPSSSNIMDTMLRKIAPDKQALNEEELRSLVENDELHAKTELLYSAQQSTDSESQAPSNT